MIADAVARRLAVAFGLTLLMAPPLAQAQPDAQSVQTDAPVSSAPSVTTATYGDWTLHCVTAAPTPPAAGAGASQRNCEITLTVRVAGQAQPMARLAVGRLPGKEDLIMTAVLPVNVSLPGRVHVAADAESGDSERGGIELSWTRCIPGACLADGSPGKAALEIMRAKPSGQLSFVDANGKTLGIRLSWRGFAQALHALLKDGSAS